MFSKFIKPSPGVRWRRHVQSIERQRCHVCSRTDSRTPLKRESRNLLDLAGGCFEPSSLSVLCTSSTLPSDEALFFSTFVSLLGWLRGRFVLVLRRGWLFGVGFCSAAYLPARSNFALQERHNPFTQDGLCTVSIEYMREESKHTPVPLPPPCTVALSTFGSTFTVEAVSFPTS